MTTMRIPKPPRQRMFDAIHNDDARELDIALRSGANVDDCNDEGIPALHLASRRSGAVFNKVLAAASNLNAQDTSYGCTALHCAAFSGYTENAKALLHAGADYSVRSKFGETAHDIAIAIGCPSIARAIEARQAEDLRQQLERNTAPAPAFPDLTDPATLDQVSAQQAQQPKRRGMRL
jgi:ankyrin repeat protein